MKLIDFTNKGIYCPQGDFYIDPWYPVNYAVITHGHADHARWGMKKYLCHHYTKNILKRRISEDLDIQSIDYGESITKNGVKITMFPAGHVIGSAQVRLEYKGYTTVVSGDYKIENDFISTPFEIVKCNEFVTESTFALPIYNWLEPAAINQNLIQWAAQNKTQEKTTVFAGYSLGKAQRILKALEEVDEVFVHSSIAKLNEAFSESGIDLPAYKTLDFSDNLKEVKGKIVIVPPALLGSNVIKKIPNAATAICSGWMHVRGSRRWRSADAGFAMSDHADWKGLLKAIKNTDAEVIHVTHGFVDVFSKYLNEIGYTADVVQTQFSKNDVNALSDKINSSDQE